jgi:hypothetical protein
MKLSAQGGQAKPVVANATVFNPWELTIDKTINNFPIFILSRVST